MNSKTAKCGSCDSFNTKRNGHKYGLQRYKCNDCNKNFSNVRWVKNNLRDHIWDEYVFGKQTIRELEEDENLNIKTIKKYLSEYVLEEKKHNPRIIKALVIDSTYLRKKKHTNTWCAAVFRDYFRKENIYHDFGLHESNTLYQSCRRRIEDLGYTIESIVSDGNVCIRGAFRDIPIQMCLIHMKRLVTQNISLRPKTEAGQVLLALTNTLIYTDSKTFRRRFDNYKKMYNEFYNERTYHENGSWSWTHEGVRSATLSIQNNLPYLFSFEENKDLPKTTNSLEGHFSHVKDIIRIHRGIGEKLLKKVLSSIFNNSSIVKPKKKKGK